MKLTYLITQSGLFEASVVNQLFFSIDIANGVLTYQNIFNLAKMTNNAYYVDTTNYWIPIPPYNWTQLQNEYVKGYVFTDIINKAYVISFKGTNILPYEQTTKYDKYNDNLFFSCCFNKTNYNHNMSCNECSKQCYKQTLDDPKNYISIAKNMMQRLKEIIDFSNNTILFTGHSLGGAIATSMGLLFSKTVVTFQTPGEKHYIENTEFIDTSFDTINNIYHFGHNKDPIFSGNCGWWCKMGGYYIETHCHIGYVCRFNTTGYSSLLKHKMSYVIDNIESWNGTLPPCKRENNCSECN
jgi:lipase ATG15